MASGCRFCGNDKPSTVVVSDGEELLVLFRAKYKNNQLASSSTGLHGFKLLYKAGKTPSSRREGHIEISIVVVVIIIITIFIVIIIIIVIIIVIIIMVTRLSKTELKYSSCNTYDCFICTQYRSFVTNSLHATI